MTHTKRSIRICAVLLVLNVLFIWGNSLLPGNVSASFSRYIKKILEYILPFGDDSSEFSHGLLRKIAHFTEFACLGALLAWLYTMLSKTTVLPKKPILLLPCGALFAGVDELIQRFVPGRGSSFADVLIDVSGAVLGTLLVLAIYSIRKKKK